ncbi:MAG TPA: UvrD-helicase domain-containing protein [bacterium]|nr:UvrD-helicase domain-containing protein [bacterium]
MKDFLKNLNLSQNEAVKHGDGPALVIAGAGSGKTTVLTYRVCYLLKRGIEPRNILAVTFTNKAAAEMKERIRKLVGGNRDLWIGTFHSICLRILRRDAARLGFGGDFSIYDDDDQLSLIELCLKELGIEDKEFKPRAVQERISRAKSSLIWPDEFAKARENFRDTIISRVYELYQQKLRRCNALDFDDLISLTVKLFMDHPRVLEEYQARFTHILIDEYQDTNHAQYRLIKLLGQGNGDVFAVGDEDQSIYGFRGADITNILDFQKDFSSSQLYRLEQNYRSTQNILRAANGLIAHNEERIGKTLWTKNEVGDKIFYHHFPAEHHEVEFVVKMIKELYHRKRFRLGEIVVFYRVHALSRIVEEGLRRAHIPYEIIGGVGFYGRREIKDILAYMKVVGSSADDISLRRIINVPARGIGAASVGAIAAFAKSHALTLYDALKRCADVPGVPAKTRAAVAKFVTMIDGLRRVKDELPATKLLSKIIDVTGYVRELEAEHTDESIMRLENIKELRSAAAEFEARGEAQGAAQFLEEISLYTDIDFMQDDDDKVTLMTVHAAKGLEFGAVFMVGMEKGIFPYARAMSSGREIEEERRLCYVAMTRAKKTLFLSSVESRMLFGSRTSNERSPFLLEIPPQLMEDLGAGRVVKFDPEEELERGALPRQTRRPSDHAYATGDRVSHPRFGKGEICKIMGQGDDTRISVSFSSQPGPMLLLAKFANLKKLP